MSFIKNIFKSEIDEPRDQQTEDFRNFITPYFGPIKNFPSSGCDSLPGAKGAFGLNPLNPIPVNGIKGEFVYINRLRSKSGVGFLFHRIRSLESAVTPFSVDEYEIVSIDASQWNVLYFVPYYPWRSNLCPEGLSLMPWNSLDELLRILVKLPCFGTNIFCDDFPQGLPQLIESDFRLGPAMARRVKEILDQHRGKWVRPNFIKNSPDEKDRGLLKTKAHNIISEIAKSLTTIGLGKLKFNVLELTIFGMFIVTETYTLAKESPKKSNEQLDNFHLDMLNYVTNKYFMKETKSATIQEINKFQDQFDEMVGSRYKEYRRLLANDLNNPSTIFKKTLDSFIGHLLEEPLKEDHKPQIIVPLGIKLGELFLGAVKSLKIN